jgi:hypothetical protein
MEFGVAFIHASTKALPDPTETRKVRFEPTQQEEDEPFNDLNDYLSESPIFSPGGFADEEIFDEIFMHGLVAPAIQRDIAQALNRAGFKVNLKDPGNKDLLRGRWLGIRALRCHKRVVVN